MPSLIYIILCSDNIFHCSHGANCKDSGGGGGGGLLIFYILIFYQFHQAAANQSQSRPPEQQLNNGLPILASMWRLERSTRARNSTGTALTIICTDTVTAPGVLVPGQVSPVSSRVWKLMLCVQPASGSGNTGLAIFMIPPGSLVTSRSVVVSVHTQPRHNVKNKVPNNQLLCLNKHF